MVRIALPKQSDPPARRPHFVPGFCRNKVAADRVGTNVFIGHGRAAAWRELKDFVPDRLGRPWDEFNRVPVAGITNIAQLSEMLDASAIALLVMTAEDEMADGEMQARMNVVHEAGLFQGRLGFTKAIVVLEEGCAEFSNIQRLGQIRFPKGKIGAAFEEVRRVLEREGIIEESSYPNRPIAQRSFGSIIKAILTFMAQLVLGTEKTGRIM